MTIRSCATQKPRDLSAIAKLLLL